jgi:hypothetical protein
MLQILIFIDKRKLSINKNMGLENNFKNKIMLSLEIIIN